MNPMVQSLMQYQAPQIGTNPMLNTNTGGFSPNQFTGQPGGYSPNQFSQGGNFMPSMPTPTVATNSAPQGGGMFSADSMFGNSETGTGGWVMPAVNAATGLAQSFLGMQQYGLAKDMFKENKKQFKYNSSQQASLLNTQMADRQKARVASNPGAYESVSSYMGNNKVKAYG